MKKFITLDQLKLEVKKYNITSVTQYHKQRKPDWPSRPDTYYKNWISYNDLFGKPEKISLEQLKKEVKKYNINTREQYKKQRKPDWPSTPNQHYKSWIGWKDLFGKPVANFLTLKQLKKEVKKHNITSVTQYKKQRKPDWPSQPPKYYKNWISWNNLFGKPVINYLTLDQLKKEVKKYNINGVRQYKKQRKPNWPSNPDQSYKNWISWRDLLGKPEKITLDELKLEVKKHNITSFPQYKKQRKSNWPSHPHRFYKNWISYNNLFGKSINIRNFVIKRLKAS